MNLNRFVFTFPFPVPPVDPDSPAADLVCALEGHIAAHDQKNYLADPTDPTRLLVRFHDGTIFGWSPNPTGDRFALRITADDAVPVTISDVLPEMVSVYRAMPAFRGAFWRGLAGHTVTPSGIASSPNDDYEIFSRSLL